MWQCCERQMSGSSSKALSKDKLETLFALLPTANSSSVPEYIVVNTLERPTYICEKILYQTRPGFWATGALWTPRYVKTNAATKKAPGVLMVIGHTPDGFRANDLGENLTENENRLHC
jgi:hypothetical protein